MKRKESSLPSSFSLLRARTSAAGYRIVGKPASAGALPMPRIDSSDTPFWHPSLLGTLRAPLTRLRD